jgi:hypothetical protein
MTNTVANTNSIPGRQLIDLYMYITGDVITTEGLYSAGKQLSFTSKLSDVYMWCRYKVPNIKVPNHKIPNNKVPNNEIPK